MKDITPRILQQQWGHDAWKQNGQDGHEVNVRGDEKIAAGAPKSYSCNMAPEMLKKHMDMMYEKCS